MNSIHFCPMVRSVGEKVRIHSSLEDGAFFDLCLRALSGFEFYLAFQVDIPGSQDTLIQISIKRPDRHSELRMVCDDLIGGLSLCDQRGDNHIFLSAFMLCHADARTGIMQAFPVFSVSKFCIIAVLMGNGTMVDGFGASVADIRSLIETVTAFPYKFSAGLVAGREGSAFYITEDDPAAYICFAVVITVDAEVVSVIKSAFVIPVAETVSPDFLGDGSRVFAEIFDDLLKREPLI